MRVLLSTIGSRGDVQPLVALALELKAASHDVRLCVPPDFRAWIEGLGLSAVPIGPEVRSTGRTGPAAAPPTPEQRRQMVDATVATQFETLSAAARDRDVILGATALQIAAPSVAETLNIPYVFAAYCPAVLPSAHHPPPVLGMLGDAPAPPPAEYAALWARDGERFAATFGPPLNAQRAARGLAPVDDVRAHVLTDRPWLAADPTIGPWPRSGDDRVRQAGAWIVQDRRALAPRIDAFLDAGDAPVYFGFGSIRAPGDLAASMVYAARAVGRRAIVSRGWASLQLPDAGDDCLVIDEVNLQALFKRVAAVVHHGGAGTTTAAAQAGAAQVVVPQMYDQHYWAQRVEALGVGVAHAPGAPTADSLAGALTRALQPGVTGRARAVAPLVRTDGASTAVRWLEELMP